MKLSTKLLIDRFLGEPICFTLNALGSAIRVFRHGRKTRIPALSGKKLAVMKFMGIGSITKSIPFLSAIKNQYPDCHITFITFQTNRHLVRRMECVDEVIEVNDSRLLSLLIDTCVLIGRLLTGRYAAIIDLEVHSKYSTVITALSLTGQRLGFYSDTTLFRKNLYTVLIYFNIFKHIEEIYEEIFLKTLMIRFGSRQGVPDRGIRITDDDRKELYDYFRNNTIDPDRRGIVININAGELRVERKWPKDRFVRLIDAVSQNYGNVNLYLSGSHRETADVESVRVSLAHPASVYNLAGKLGLGAFLELLRRSDLLVTNDSGPLHLAILLGTPTVSLWGPGSPSHYGPRGNGHRVLHREIYCSPCLYLVDRPPCEGNNLCMQRITVEDVMSAIDELLLKVPSL